MKTIIGCLLICSSIILIALFEYSVVQRAYTPKPNGNYGELYGPVSFLRIPIDAGMVIVGIYGIVLVVRARTDSMRGITEK